MRPGIKVAGSHALRSTSGRATQQIGCNELLVNGPEFRMHAQQRQGMRALVELQNRAPDRGRINGAFADTLARRPAAVLVLAALQLVEKGGAVSPPDTLGALSVRRSVAVHALSVVVMNKLIAAESDGIFRNLSLTILQPLVRQLISAVRPGARSTGKGRGGIGYAVPVRAGSLLMFGQRGFQAIVADRDHLAPHRQTGVVDHGERLDLDDRGQH